MSELEIEKAYLTAVLEFLDSSVTSMQEKNEKSKADIMALKEYLNTMMKISPDEIVKIYAQVEEDFEIVEQRLAKIDRFKKVRKSPYFGKVTINEFGENEDLYIGLFDISSVETGKQYVLDWRAPICSLYYHSKLGKTTYRVNDNEYEVDLINKRQITIKNSELEYYCDTSTKIDDEVLQEILSRNTSAYMANIIKTIQAEQDEIIRQPLYKTIVVDGVAGSGKTSIGMHRIAYLLYENRETLTNENILILSPNELFSQYISQLLPELGEDNVKTIPFSLLLSEKFHNLRDAESKSEMMEDIFFTNVARLPIVQAKYTTEYANALCEFLGNFDVEKCIGTITVRGKRVNVPALRRTYKLNEKNKHKIFKRIDFIIDEIADQVFYGKLGNGEGQHSFREEVKETILKKIYKFKLFNAFTKLAPNASGATGAVASVCGANAGAETVAEEITPTTAVTSIAESIGLSGSTIQASTNGAECGAENGVKGKTNASKKGGKRLVNDNISFDDIPTYAFIEMCIKGFDADNTIKQLFIDEVQDYSPISIKMIHELFPSATVTLVGDYHQNLITTAKNLDAIKAEYPLYAGFKLSNSYRSSSNIMRLANSVVNTNLKTTLMREGGDPTLYEFSNEGEIADKVEEILQTLDSHQKTAIICKTRNEAEQLSKLLPDFTPVFDEKLSNPFFERNKIITTTFLSKGLEFDNVIIYNANAENFNSDTDRQILYVMITRALHSVNLLYSGELSPLLKDAPNLVKSN